MDKGTQTVTDAVAADVPVAAKSKKENETSKITDVFTAKHLEAVKNNFYYAEFSGKSIEEIETLLQKKLGKSWTAKQKSERKDAGYAAFAQRVNEALQRRDENLVFNQGGKFTITVEGENYEIPFHYAPGEKHLVFNSGSANPITSTGFRSDFGIYPLNYESFPELIERRVRFHVADQHNEQIGKKEKAVKSGRAENLEFSGLIFERTELGYMKFFDSLKNSDESATPKEDKFSASSSSPAPDRSTEISLDLVVPSPFESQAKRRARFTDEEIAELASSIEQHSLLSPIVLRAAQPHGKFEIVAGERRFLAVKKLGLDKIACTIKQLSDQAAFEVQTVENLQRKEPDPLDEAASYKEYIDKFGMTENDLSVKFGKPVKFIAGRLKFNDLIPEALEQVAAKRLPLGHASEITKYSPEAQKIILKKGVYSSLWVGSDSGLPDVKNNSVETVKSLVDVKQFIKREILHNLDTAPFSKKATNLRPDGLACVNCPQRTKARFSLFEDDIIGENDNCLNPNCFSLKMTNHIELKRKEVAEASGRAVESVVYITSNYQNTYNGAETIASWRYREVKKDKCDSTEQGVFIDGNQVGLAINLCPDKECAVHWNQANSQKPLTPEDKKTAEAREKENRQDKFERLLRTSVRRSILSKISARPNFVEEFLSDEELVSRLAALVFEQNKAYSSSPLEELIKASGYEINQSDDERDEAPTGWENSILKLDTQTRMQVLFMSLLDYDSTISENQSIVSTKNLAQRFEVDYALVEAETLLQVAPDEFKLTTKEYLAQKLEGLDAVKPSFYFEKEYFDYPMPEEEDDDDDIDENDLGETSQG